MTAVFERITIIGLGLIGSSIARAARQYKLADIIIGCDTSETALNYCRSNKLIDMAMTDPKTAIQTTQLIIIATPPSALEGIAKSMEPSLKPGMIVMDCASVKRAAMEAIAPHLPAGVDFIPAHPIAGSEQSGANAGRADLFKGKRVIVTPAEISAGRALQSITAFWKAMGAKLEGMPAPMHDMVYGYVSHLPQLLAFAAYSTLEPSLPPPGSNAALDSFLRIAHSNPSLWLDIFELNKDNILTGLDRYLDAAAHVQKELLQAPEPSKEKMDAALAKFALFPRIAASCLATTVIEAEKNAGISFVRFAGTGFADFTSPAAIAPEQDIEHISNQSQAVAALLTTYIGKLRTLRQALAADDCSDLKTLLTKKPN